MKNPGLKGPGFFVCINGAEIQSFGLYLHTDSFLHREIPDVSLKTTFQPEFFLLDRAVFSCLEFCLFFRMRPAFSCLGQPAGHIPGDAAIGNHRLHRADSRYGLFFRSSCVLASADIAEFRDLRARYPHRQ